MGPKMGLTSFDNLSPAHKPLRVAVKFSGYRDVRPRAPSALTAEFIYAAAMGEREMSAKDAWLAKYTLDAESAVLGSVTESLESSHESEVCKS